MTMSKKSPSRARHPIDYKERFLRKCVKIFSYADRMGFGTWDTMEEEEEFFVYGVVDWYPVRDILARLEEEQVGFNRVELLLFYRMLEKRRDAYFNHHPERDRKHYDVH